MHPPVERLDVQSEASIPHTVLELSLSDPSVMEESCAIDTLMIVHINNNKLVDMLSGSFLKEKLKSVSCPLRHTVRSQQRLFKHI